MSTDIKTLPYNNIIGRLMFLSKISELLQVANKYNISFDELKNILDKELSKSEFKVGTCNTAVDFLIIETLYDNKLYRSINVAIENNIFMAATYYTNGINKKEYDKRKILFKEGRILNE